MNQTDLHDLAERFFHGQDRLKGPIPPELLTDDYVAEIAGFPPMDAAGHGGFGQAFYSAFPDLHHTIDEVRAMDDGVVVRFTVRGTQTDDFMGLPPTGLAIEVTAIVLLTIDGERVSHLRAIFDRFGMLQQLGVIPD